MTLFDMFEHIKFVANKNFDGLIITPARFNEIIKIANIDHFRDKYGLPESYQPGRPIATDFADATLKNTDDLKAFKQFNPNRAVVNGVMTYPATYAHRQSIVYNYSKTINHVATVLPRPVEVLREEEFAARTGNYTKQPTLANPIAVLRNDGVHIRPLTIVSVDFHFYRFPLEPIFSYTLGDGFITYDATGSVEMEWPEDEKLVIMRRCLEYIGVNLRSEELVNYANTKLQTG